MNLKLKSPSTLLGLSLVAVMSNNAMAYEHAEPKSGCSQGGEHGYGAHSVRRMLALHTVLKLTAGQEPAWTEFSGKMKTVEMNRHAAHQDWAKLSTPDRLDRMLGNMKLLEKSMAEHVAAVRSFYDTLSPEQKKAFDTHFMGPHHHDHDFHNKK